MFILIKDYNLSTQIEQLGHVVWGKPYSEGTLKALFVTGVRSGREVVELIQRMDVDHQSVTFDKITALNEMCFGDFYNARGGIGNFNLMYENLEIALTSDEQFDVMVIPGCAGWGFFTESTRKAILERVKNGAGLIMVQPFNGDPFETVPELDELSPLKPLYSGGRTNFEGRNPQLDLLKKDKWVPSEHYINSGIPFEIFPYDEIAYFPYEAKGEVIIKAENGDPIVAVKEYGKGRVVALAYYPRDIAPQHSEFIGWDPCYESVTSTWHGAFDNTTFNYIEYFYSFINRTMIWAAAKEPCGNITNINVDGLQMSVEISKQCLSCFPTLEYNVFDMYDNKVFCGVTNGAASGGIANRTTAGIATGTTAGTADGTTTGTAAGADAVKALTAKLPEMLAYGGKYRIDTYLKKDGKAVDWFTKIVNYPSKADISDLITSSDCVNYNDKIKITLNTTGEFDVEFSLIDDYDRIIDFYSEKISSLKNTVECSLKADTKKSMHVRVQADIIVNGHLVKRITSGRIIVAPTDREFTDYEVFNCPQNRGHGEFLKLERERLIEMGCTGLYFGDNKMSTVCGVEDLGIFWWDRAPYAEQKEKYITTQDKKYLHRWICLNSDEYRNANRKRILETVGVNKKYGPVSYFANDEGSLTCYADDLELCFCDYCLKDMREWLKTEFASLDELNETWGRAFKTWEEVIPYTYIEAKKANNFASWGDHRRFMELTFANTYKFIKDSIREVDPPGKVRMSGTQNPTPYNGYDYYMLHQQIGYFEIYDVGNQFELHRSFQNPGTVLGAWSGYGSSGKTVYSKLWEALFHGLTLISIFWEYACINPDFTYSKSAIDMSAVYKEIKREGIGKLLLYSAKRDSLGIAIHYSMPSLHGSYVKGEDIEFSNNRQGWINVLEDLGYQYNFVASQQVEAGELMAKGYKVLIMPYSIAISKKESEEIRQFVNAGGLVIGDFQTGIMDQHNKLYDEGSLDDVFGIKRFMNLSQRSTVTGEMVRVDNFKYFDNKPALPEFQFIELGTRATTAKYAYVNDFSRTYPIVSVNEFGKGKAVYLNFPLYLYPDVRKKKSGGAHTRYIIDNIIKLSDVSKFASISNEGDKPLTGFETIYYSDNTAKYVAFNRELGGDVVIGFDGLAIGNAANVSESVEKLIVKFDAKAHIYDIRCKNYLGYTDNIKASIANGDNCLLSILPYKVDSISVIAPHSINKGETLSINMKIVSDKPDGEYNNVLSVNAFTPSGEYFILFSENVIVSGKESSVSMKLGYNEEVGNWKFVVKDVATGVSSEVVVEVK